MLNKRVRDEWEIREDARTLARAEEIKGDSERYREASDMASKLADERLDEIQGLLKVSKKSCKKNKESSNKKIPEIKKGTRNNNAAFVKKL